MDWELLGLTLLFVTPGLIVGVVNLLGFTRTEIALIAAYFVAFASWLLTINAYASILSDTTMKTKTDIDAWFVQLQNANTVCDAVGWLVVAIGGAFLFVALAHIWRERYRIWSKLAAKSSSFGEC